MPSHSRSSGERIAITRLNMLLADVTASISARVEGWSMKS